jgi:dipeptidyl-peptidase-4
VTCEAGGNAGVPGGIQDRVALSGPHEIPYFNPGFVEASDSAAGPKALARISIVDNANRLAGRLLLIHGGMDDQVDPDHTLRLADRLIAADKDFELLIVPGADHTYINHLAYVRKRCWDLLVCEVMGVQPPTYRRTPIPIDPQLLAELFT